jgi:penicillin-binding protein 1A
LLDYRRKKYRYVAGNSTKRRSGPIIRILKIAILSLMVLIVAGFSTLAGIFVYFSQDLPKLDKLSDYLPNVKTTVYSYDNELIGEFYVENREVIDIGEIPDIMVNAIIAAEDRTFFEHRGIDFLSVLRAAYINLMEGKVVQGASTITQQVAKTFLLSSERRFSRKIKEAIIASRIEEKFTKNEILHLYLNQIFFGHNSFGIKVAAENYFDKEVEDLNVAECALLAALPKAPTSTSPFVNPQKARNRQLYVLRRMREEGFISEGEYELSRDYELKLKGKVEPVSGKTPYFTEHIRRYLKSRYGDAAVYRGGLTVYTTVDYRLQQKAQEAVRTGLFDLDKRQGYRGVRRHLELDEIEEFIQATREDEGLFELELDKVYKDYAVVTKIDDEEMNITIQLGNHEGILELEDFKWARSPDPEIPYYSPDVVIEMPSEVFRLGDVIDVKVASVNIGVEDEEGVDAEDAEQGDKEQVEDELEEQDKPPYTFSLYQEPLGQAAIVSIDVHTGFVNVMVGGYDFNKSEFNRAVQAKRLPGSAFKPVIYAAAIDWEPEDGKYYTPATVIYDTALVFEDGKWKPSNYGRKFKGAVSLRKAVAKSVNIPAVKVLSDIGVDYVVEYAKKLKINAYINPDPTAALGSSAMNLLELTSVYGIFASGGLKVDTVFVTKVVDRFGNVLEEYIPYEDRIKETQPESNEDEADIAEPDMDEAIAEDELSEDELPEEEKVEGDPRRVMSASTAYIMTDLLQSVVKEGTGWRVKKAFGDIPLAGKTGTTNDFIDAWFIGYSPDIVTGVWTGFDEEGSLGKSESGSRAAAPIWVEYMQEALKDKPVKNFPVPSDIEFIKIDPATGLLARSGTVNAKFEIFKKGTVPAEYTTTSIEDKSDDFFITDLEEEKVYKESKNNINKASSVKVFQEDDEAEDEFIPVVIP